MSLMRTSIPASCKCIKIACISKPRGEETHPDTGVGGILDGLQQRVINRVECHSESTVHDAAIEMRTEINLHHISLVQDHLIARIGSVVCSTVVDAQTAREAHTTLEVITFLQTLVACQGTYRIFNAFRNLGQGLTGLDVLLRILADLTVDLGTLAILLQEVIVHAIEITLLLVGGAVGVIVQVFADLALGVLVIGEKVGDGDPWRGALDLGATLLLLLGLALLLLLGGYRTMVLAALFLLPSRERG